MTLTKSNVTTLPLPAGKKQELYWDTDVSGFALSVRNHRTFIFRYRANGRDLTNTIGRVNAVTFSQAKQRAKELRATTTLGGDPQGAKKAARTLSAPKLTYRSAVETYLPMREGEVRPATFRIMRSYLTSPDYFGAFDRLDLASIDRKTVAARLAEIRTDKGDISANAARANLSAMFARLIAEGIADVNPVDGTAKGQERSERERTLSDDEIAKVWAKCGDDDYGRLIRLLLLTGCRRQELGSLKWSEIDFEKGIIVIPGERTKNKQTHTLPLPPLAMSILETIPRIVGRDLVFGDRSSDGFVSWARAKDALKDGCADWVVHDLRRTVATGMGDLGGIQPHIIEAVLNHQSGSKAGVAGTYNRSPYADEVKTALARWASHIETICNGGEEKIVSLRAA
jgi:integrase